MEKFIIHPETDLESEPYWASLKEHDAKLQKCGNCDRFRFPPLPSCPYCGVAGGEWAQISGKGTVYSWIVVHHPIDPRLIPELPFVVALIDLQEGSRVAARLTNVELDKIKVDLPVQAVYEDVDDSLTLYNFEPLN